MKTTIRLIVAAFGLAIYNFSTAVVQAEEYSYTTNNGTITITKYTGLDGVVNIPDAITGLPVTSIGNEAFSGCSSLTSVTIPHSVTDIGDWAFADCTSLTNLTIADTVTSIGNEAFSGCSSLTSVTIPDSVTSIGDEAFGACWSLTAITVDALNPNYSSVDGVLFDKNQTTLILCPGVKVGSYTIPKSVTSIGDYAFRGCDSLTNLTIADTVTNIGNYTFSGCSSLTSVTIPKSVTELGIPFYDCDSLTGVYFKGNAPSNDWGGIFFGHARPVVYYLPGTTGWDTTFRDRPTALWLPKVQTSDSNFGVWADQFGFTINWTSGVTVVVEASTSLANPSWVPLETHTFRGDSWYFSDADWANYPSRFYRIRVP